MAIKHNCSPAVLLYQRPVPNYNMYNFMFVSGSSCGGDIILNKTKSIASPRYPAVTSPGVKCTWRIVSPRGKSVVVQAINLNFGSEMRDDCDKGKLQIFNGCGNEPFLVEQICLVNEETHQHRILWVSSGPCVTIKFFSGQGRKNKFRLSIDETEGEIEVKYSQPPVVMFTIV